MSIIGTILIVIGIGMMIAKWFFGIEQIGSWTLVPLFSGIFFNWLANRKKGQVNG